MDTGLEKISQAFEPLIKKKVVYQGELTITIDRKDLFQVMLALKNEHGFDYLVDIHATDHFRDEDRFEVAYNVFNIAEKKRIRVKCFLPEDDAEVESVVSIWPSANWYEREAWDMIGVRFRNHPDLRRIYMPEDFEFHPLRKEFPLIGIPGSIQLPEKDAPKPYK